MAKAEENVEEAEVQKEQQRDAALSVGKKKQIFKKEKSKGIKVRI